VAQVIVAKKLGVSIQLTDQFNGQRSLDVTNFKKIKTYFEQT